MKSLLALCMALLVLSACAPAATPTLAPTVAPAPTIAPAPTQAPVPTQTPVAPTSAPVGTNTPLPPQVNTKLELKAVPPDKLVANCSFKPFTNLGAQGLTRLAQLQTVGCAYGEITLFQIGDRLYTAQAGLRVTLFNMVDVTDPTAPQPIGAWFNKYGTGYAADIKHFQQNDRHFLAISFDDFDKSAGLCGIAILEVTDPHTPQVLGLYDASQVGSDTPWCNIHTVEIDTDAQGNGNYLLASELDTWSLRVLDIRDLNHIQQINTYHLHAHPHADPSDPSQLLNFVHDSAITADRVYVAYWHAGAVVLDKQTLYAGKPQEGTVVQPTEHLASSGFLTHYTYPTADGNYLFLQDEVNIENGIRLFDIHDLTHPREVATLQLQDPIYTPHNFIVQDNLLYVGWLQDGVRVFRFDLSDSAKPQIEPAAFYAVREIRSSGSLGAFTGIWGLRLHSCNVQGETRTCIYASDVEGGLLILALDKGIAAE